MNSKLFRYSGIVSMILSFIIISYAAYKASIGVLIFGIIFMLVSVIYVIFSLSFELFQRDKQLDYEALSEAGLTITKCPKCQNKNVLEDQYCIFCGEKLVKTDESV